MIHYGHSCLVPIDVTTIKMLYVFVDIAIDIDHVRLTNVIKSVKMTNLHTTASRVYEINISTRHQSKISCILCLLLKQ